MQRICQMINTKTYVSVNNIWLKAITLEAQPPKQGLLPNQIPQANEQVTLGSTWGHALLKECMRTLDLWHLCYIMIQEGENMTYIIIYPYYKNSQNWLYKTRHKPNMPKGT